jgi:hypothetical protein
MIRPRATLRCTWDISRHLYLFVAATYTVFDTVRRILVGTYMRLSDKHAIIAQLIISFNTQFIN